jgi:hypothetical protein
VTTPDAANISKVTLISLTSTTHTLDANQRFIELPFTRNNGALDVTMPANGNLAPPTYYMLFVVNNQGVPSTAAMIRLPAPGEDNQAPTAPSNLTASTSGHTVGLSWTAAIDNVGVTNYKVYRGVTAGFTPGVSNLIGQSAATTYSDAAISGTVYYKVTAQDLAGNTSAPSNEAIAVLPDDVVAPAVAMTFPADGSTVNSTVAVSAQASDDVGVAGVQFLVDGNNLGAEDTAAPFSVPWDTTTATNASHRLSARARDARGNTTVSSEISVSVNNTALFTIDFNNLTSVQAPLNGQYPTGVVNWGTNIWWLSSPWGQFTTNSISFNGSGPTSGTFSFASARVLVSLKAFNGGTASSTVTLSCTGNTSQTVSVAVNQLATIATGWTTPCTTVTVTSSNGWNTNFDDLMYR